MALTGARMKELPPQDPSGAPELSWFRRFSRWGWEVKAILEALFATQHLQLGAAAGQSLTATWTPATGGVAAYWLGAGAANTVEFAIPLERSRRVTAVRMTGRSVGTAWTFRVWLIDEIAGTRAQLGATKTSGVASTREELAVTGLTTTLADGQHVVAEWTSGAALTRCYAVELEYDRKMAQ